MFIEMIHNPVMQFVAQFMMGKSAFVGATFGNIKTCQQGSGKGLHADQFNIQSPWPTYDHYANLSWLLSDYNGLEDGPTVLIPGSHLRSTQPHPASGKNMEEIQLLLDQDKSEHTKPVAITGFCRFSCLLDRFDLACSASKVYSRIALDDHQLLDAAARSSLAPVRQYRSGVVATLAGFTQVDR